MGARIQAIPTRHLGVQFRSKLEADWARVLDEHRIRWAYEPEGFDVEGVWYLPDLWLPDLRTIVEVKGILDKGVEKVCALALATAALDVQVVLAEAPAGASWRMISTAGILGERRSCLDLCPACSTWQFMAAGCRRCSHRNELYPGYARFASTRLREWAEDEAAEGEHSRARDLVAAADAIGGGR